MAAPNQTKSTPVPSLNLLSPEEVSAQFDRGEAIIVDVREPYERAVAFIPESHAAPLTSFDAEAIRTSHPSGRLIFHCKSGARAADAAKRYAQATGAADVCSLAGGIDAWRKAGLPLERSAQAPKLDIMRQVQMVAGGLVLTGVLLGAFVHAAFLILPGFVGSGLIFAGASGWCGMARLLAVMPWNRVTGASCRISTA